MDRWVELGRASAPEGDDLTLRRRGSEFEIRFNGWEAMSSRNAVSETAFARLICEQLRTESPWILIGGLGMGYTLRATLDAVNPKARIVVAELVPEIVRWNRGPLAELARRPLDDMRVEVRTDGVVEVLQACERRYDAILLDVDNGPDTLLYRPNRFLYSPAGLELLKRALAPNGIVGVWSADHSLAFENALETAGMIWRKVEVTVESRGDGVVHIIYLARRAVDEE
jgi:spermidine synthase